MKSLKLTCLNQLIMMNKILFLPALIFANSVWIKSSINIFP